MTLFDNLFDLMKAFRVERGVMSISDEMNKNMIGLQKSLMDYYIINVYHKISKKYSSYRTYSKLTQLKDWCDKILIFIEQSIVTTHFEK